MLRKGYGGLYKAPQRKKEESEQLRGEREQIKFIDLRFERWQVDISIEVYTLYRVKDRVSGRKKEFFMKD